MEEMKKRFDEQFLIRVRNPLGWKLPRIAYFWEQSGKDVEWEDMEVELKSFTQSEVDLAVSKERERVTGKTDEVWDLLCQMDTNVKSEKEYAKDIINLINTK